MNARIRTLVKRTATRMRPLATHMLLLVLALSLPATARAGVYAVAVIQNANAPYQVNLRAGKGTSTESLGLYYSGTLVTVHYTEGDWCRVSVHDRDGYMQKKFLVDAGDQRDTRIPDNIRDARPYGVVNNPNPADRLNLRGKPNEDWRSEGKYYNGTEVQIMGEYEGWYHVLVDDRNGYMMAKFIDKGKRSGTGSIGEAVGTAVVQNPSAADRLHLRKEAKSGATSLGKYYTGVKVDVLGYETSDWSLVRIGDTVGYMKKEFLRFGADGDRVTSAIPDMKVANATNSEPSLLELPNADGSTRIGPFADGTEVEILGIVEGGWYHARVGDKIGYMQAKYLK